MFNDRKEAGYALAEKLGSNPAIKAPGVVLAVPGGGVPVGYAVAHMLGWHFELLLVGKIGHPKDREQAIGAVSSDDSYILPYAGIPASYIQQETGHIRQRLQHMQEKFYHGTDPQSIKGKTVVMVDDGIVTGNLLLEAMPLLHRQGASRIIVATPVIFPLAAVRLHKVADDLITLETAAEGRRVGSYYKDFHTIGDREILDYLNKVRKEAVQALEG